MSTSLRPFLFPRRASATAGRFLVIHDSIVSGLRAKQFADRATSQESFQTEPELSLWMEESLRVAECAVAAWMEAEKCDTVVISLSADSELSDALQIWIEAWLQYAGGERTRLVVLLESSPEHLELAQALRSYFTNLTDRHGVELSWHSATSSGPVELDGHLDEFAALQPRGIAPGRGLFTAAAAFAA